MLCAAMMFGVFAWSQNNVTFQVDMNQQLSISANGVHIAGDFQAAAGYPGNWNPSTAELLDPDGDGIYELTVSLPAGSYQYKYINGNAWGTDEFIPSGCAVGGNRGVTISGDTVLTAFCFGQCSPCGGAVTYDVTFQVDMNAQTAVSPNGVHVAGDFQASAGYAGNWNPATTMLSDPDADGIYSLTVQLPAGTYQYKYVNGNAWGSDEGVPAACASNNNRNFSVAADTVLPAYCFGTCNILCASQQTYFVQFRVDMSSECDWDSVDVAGDFNAWSGGDLLAPSGAAGVYAITKQLGNGTYGFKFRKYYNGSVIWESRSDRTITVANNMSINLTCYNSDTLCTPIPNPADISFSVNMTGQTIDSLGVFLIGDFTTPSWQAGAIQMTPNASDANIYEVTVPQICSGQIRFKYVNGDVSDFTNEEPFDAMDSSCTEANGIGGFNRYHARSGSNESLYSYWASCDTLPPGSSNVIDSIVGLNINKGVYRAYFSGLTGTDYRIEYKAIDDTVWSTKNVIDPSAGNQRFGVAPNFGTTVLVRLSEMQSGAWYPGVESQLVVPCKNQVLSIIVQEDAFCDADSVLLRAGYAGGYRFGEFLWSTGETTKRIYVDQGQTAWVTVTDEAGCMVSDTIVAPTLDATAVPSNFALSKPGPTLFQGSWSPAVLPSGASITGYRMAYRERGSLSWTNAPLTTDTFSVVDFTGSGLPAGNYEFVAFTRYNNGSGNVNSEFTCLQARGYNGSGNKTDLAGVTNASSSVAVYPNPTTGELFVSAPIGSSLVITDLNGRTILNQMANQSEVRLDLSNLANGVYVLSIANETETFTERIVKN